MSSDSDYDQAVVAKRPDIPRFKNEDAHSSVESDGLLNVPMMQSRVRTKENTLGNLETEQSQMISAGQLDPNVGFP